MAQIYPDRPSIALGGTLFLHASSAARFRVDFYRFGAQLQLVEQSNLLDGALIDSGPPDSDWAWPIYEFPIPLDWQQGVYIALAVEENAPSSASDPTDLNNDPAKALFVVSSLAPGTTACILYKIPLFTYQAYNQLGDPQGSLYTGGVSKVTMHRPGGGVGGDPWDSHPYPDVYDSSSARQTFAHWDAPFIRWLEGSGYAVEYCTDLDIHESGLQLLSSYRLLLSIGHDEYWSAEMRNNVEQFIASGGNVAFFSGNVSWWRVHLTDGNTAFTCDKSGPPNHAVDQWWTGQSQRPENYLSGVSYRNGGGSWSGWRGSVGYTVQYPKHWVYDGVLNDSGAPIQAGDIFGEKDSLVGYECDGAAISTEPDGQGNLMGAFTDGTPSNFLILGYGKLLSDWNDREAGDLSTATMGLYVRNGIVFTAATTDWARLLGNSQVDRVTRNVLDRLRSRSIRILGLGSPCSNNAVVEGATLKFRVNPASLPTQRNVTFHWTASSGAPATSDLPVFRLTLPSPPTSVTVTVTIQDRTDCPIFGTLTFTPMTYQVEAFAQLICRLREMMCLIGGCHTLVEGSKENPFFVDPLWDPLRGILVKPPSRRDMHEFLRDARALTALAGRLIERQSEN